MTISTERVVILEGHLPVAARPRLNPGRLPIPDPAYSTFLANATAAGRYHRATHPDSQYMAVGLSMASPIGAPLLFSAKPVVDGLVAAGLFDDDKCDKLPSLRVQRHDPKTYPHTTVSLRDASNTVDSFSVQGIPAPPAYTPVNATPRFNGTPRTPTAYRKMLSTEICIHSTDWSAEHLRAPSGESMLLIAVYGKTVVDLDNAALRVLDALETLRPENRSAMLLDEIIESVTVMYVASDTEAERIEFQFLDVLG